MADPLVSADRNDRWTLHAGDARDVGTFLSTILDENEEITTTITSPPYGSLIDYGVHGQVGHGQTMDEYLDDCSAIFREIGRRTRDDGSLWIVADSFVDSTQPVSKLIPLPFILADCAERSGWVLRDVITWKRDRGMPWSGRGRLRNGFEYIIHLVRTNNFQYHLDRLRDPTELARWWVRFPERYHPLGAAPTNVWDFPIPTQGSWPGGWGRHVCPLPLGLITRIIELTTEPGDIVFDPFAGTGSVLAQATILKRKSLGIEIDQKYRDSFPGLVQDLTNKDLVDSLRSKSIGAPNPDLIMKLRSLKRAKTLCSAAIKLDSEMPKIDFVIVVAGEPEVCDDGIWRAESKILVVASGSRSDRQSISRLLSAALDGGAARKYGIFGEISVIAPRTAVTWLRRDGGKWWLYPNGRTWRHDGELGSVGLERLREVSRTSRKDPTILSQVAIDLHP